VELLGVSPRSTYAFCFKHSFLASFSANPPWREAEGMYVWSPTWRSVLDPEDAPMVHGSPPPTPPDDTYKAGQQTVEARDQTEVTGYSTAIDLGFDRMVAHQIASKILALRDPTENALPFQNQTV
jgi:hypothetical protein